MKRNVLIVFFLFFILALATSGYGQEDEDKGMPLDTYSTEQSGANVSLSFEPDDVLATSDGDYWYVGKIQTVGGEGKDKEINILFSDGEEKWVKPTYVIKKFRLINQNELKVGQRVLYTTQNPDSWRNNSIRHADFMKGKITSIGKLHRNVVTINAQEVSWNTRVLIW
jgi:hypothetical protein